MDDNKEKTVVFDPREMRYFDYGEVATSRDSQGLTAERVLVNVDTGVHPEHINTIGLVLKTGLVYKPKLDF
ncbi:hypothetical protein FTO74_10720 [Granulicella sp. WH15]|uniref:hypothetical protein n=1 Tax=Granulicella sp. WH15 TaxID=2602070 RepID=UPI001366A81C|nr:hypothetical protein [Granulicella sp. WH15]QHN03794.1 hypothetical protein FTO74_10720 [Granulicella sp. WH15]